MEQETIVAISTPVGRGGIGVVRLSGPRARQVVAPLLRLRHPLAAGHARFGEWVDVNPTHDATIPHHECSTQCNAEPRVLDQVVVTYFAAPHSYTGEDVVEIAAHGSPVLLEYLVRQCCANGARLAEPGEFTQRAFLSERIDLTQAEAVNDLIASSTLEQARVAARQLGGALAKTVAPVKDELLGLIAELEAGIDFAEDDIDVMATERIAGKIAEVRAPLEALERSFAYGRIVRDGFRMAIVGRPNAGKSSLFNRLVLRDRAIVTAAPGTTRDTVTEHVAMDGIPVELIDTAGLREGADEAERMGIARSREAMAEADVVLLVVDAAVGNSHGISQEDRDVLRQAESSGSAVVVAWNKCDLMQDVAVDVPTRISDARCGAPNTIVVPTSALTGDGIGELRAALVKAVAGAEGGLRESAMLTNLRQHRAVEQALRGLDAAHIAVASGIPHEMLLLDLYESLRGLDALTGATTTDDLLHLIFSRFCIGK